MNNNLYKELFDISPNGMFYFDEKGIVIDCNQAFLKSINSTKKLMIGFDTINKLQNKKVIKEIKQCLNTGKGYYEGPYLSVTGNKNIISKGTFKGIKDKNGKIIGGLCILEDITSEHEQKQKLIDLNNEYATLNEAFLEQNEELQQVNTELNEKNTSLEKEKNNNLKLIEKLTLTEKNYKILFNNSAIPMMMYQDGIITLVNDAFLKYANSNDKSEYIGNVAINFIHDDYKEFITNKVIEAKQKNKTITEELRIITPGKNIRDVIMNIAVISFNNKESILVSFTDITELKESKEKLAEINYSLNHKNAELEEEKAKNEEILNKLKITENNYKTIFYNSPLPMIVHSQGKIVLANDAAMAFANIDKKSKVIGKSVMSFVHESSFEKAKTNIAKVMQGKNTEMQEEKFVTSDGQVKDVVVNSSQFIYNNEVALLVAFADITDIKESKNKLELINEYLNNKNSLLEEETAKNKEILDRLESAEQNYRNMFDKSPTPMSVHLDGKVLLYNSALAKLLDIPNDTNFKGQSIFQFIQKDYRENAKKSIESVNSGKDTAFGERKFLTYKGKEIDVIVNSTPFIFNNKTTVLTSLTDITELKKSEKELKIISKGIETSPASIVITDINGNIQYVNPKFVEITGYAEKEAIGLNPRILKSGTHQVEFYQNMWSLLSVGKSWRGEIQNKKKNGELFWEYSIISPIKNNNGKITHYIAIKEDITKRKEIEQKLLVNEKHFKTLYNTAPDGIFEIDKDGVIINCNIEFANSVKLKKSELIGKNASNFVGNTILFKKLFEKLKATGYIESEIAQLNGDGTTTTVWRKVTALYDKNKNFTGAIAYNRNIEKIKNVEKELIEAKEKAEEADKLKSAFLSNMSHEVRTPLNAIIGFSDLINRQNISPIEKSKYSNYIKHNSKLLLNLINDIIDISKIEANQIKIYKTKVDIKNLFSELYQTFLAESNEKINDVSLELEICKEPVIFYTDEYRLRQIITNLVSNSFKFTNKGKISFGYKKEEEKIKFFVKDTGQGISEEFSAKIFKRFFKLGTLTNNKGGTGIGLSIVKNLTELLGGEIDLFTEKNVGTEFIITFPFKENLSVEKENSDDKLELINFNWSNKTILVAEDDEFNFIVLEEILKISRINIIHAKDGIEAVNLFKSNREKIDIILMDIQMPKMNGYEATKEILKVDANAKIIAQTAFAMSNEKDKSIEAGCIDYVTKPIDIDMLTLILANYLGTAEKR